MDVFCRKLDIWFVITYNSAYFTAVTNHRQARGQRAQRNVKKLFNFSSETRLWNTFNRSFAFLLFLTSFRAAFEYISKYNLRTDAATSIDIRFTRLPKGIPPNDGYDPRDHRVPLTPIKTSMAYFNMLRTIIGTGFLGFPLSVSQAGLIMGPFFTMGIGILVTYSHYMLLESLNEVSRRLKVPHVSYRYGFRLALLRGPFKSIGYHGPTIIATCMIISQIGICTVIVIFSADCLRDILDWPSNRSVLLLLFLPFLIMEILMTNLKIVTYISTAGNLLNVFALAIVIYLTAKDMRGSEGILYYTFDALPLSFAFGNCLFNSSAVGVLLSMDRSLEDPKVLVKSFGVINIGILVPTIAGTLFGVFGYWSMGEMDENLLRYLPFDDNLALFAIGLYMFSMAFVFPIQCYPGMLITLEVIKNLTYREPPPLEKLPLYERILRPIFVVIPFTIAYVIPFQGPFVAFVGNLCTTLLALIFPALMDLSLRYPDVYGKYHWMLFRDIGIIIIGLISWTFGVYLSAKLIHKRILALVVEGAEYF